MRTEVRWAILGTGVAANQMAQAMKHAGRTIYAVGGRTHSGALRFAEKYGIQKVYDMSDDMFHDNNVDAIYIATPHNTHINFIKKGLSQGKHLLCEKAITLNSCQLDEAISLARENNVILAEAMTIYHMPLYKRLRKYVDDGNLGHISMIQLNFGSYKEYDKDNRFFNRELAGGALLDIGVYALSLARYFLDSKPDHILSTVKFAPSGVDEMSGIVMTNKEAQMAVISLSLHTKQPKRCVICGDKGYIEIMEYPRAQEAVIVSAQSGTKEIIREGCTEKALQYEMEDMEKAINGSGKDVHLSYTKDVMDIMTEIRRDWNLSYPEEKCGTRLLTDR